jgi:hypothetical protein
LPIQTRIVDRPPVKVTKIEICSLWGQEVTYSAKKLGYQVLMLVCKVKKHTMAILIIVVLFLLIVTDFGLEVDEAADGRPSMAPLNHNKS